MIKMLLISKHLFSNQFILLVLNEALNTGILIYELELITNSNNYYNACALTHLGDL